MRSDHDLYNELAFYTLAHPDPAFIHQHIVDAYAAQYADDNTKPITVTFALIGLYLYLEKGFTGKQVQRVHMRLANYRRQWPRLSLHGARGAVDISSVLDNPPGIQRDKAIHSWCASVWEAWSESRNYIVDLARTELGIY